MLEIKWVLSPWLDPREPLQVLIGDKSVPFRVLSQVVISYFCVVTQILPRPRGYKWIRRRGRDLMSTTTDRSSFLSCDVSVVEKPQVWRV